MECMKHYTRSSKAKQSRTEERTCECDSNYVDSAGPELGFCKLHNFSMTETNDAN